MTLEIYAEEILAAVTQTVELLIEKEQGCYMSSNGSEPSMASSRRWSLTKGCSTTRWPLSVRLSAR